MRQYLDLMRHVLEHGAGKTDRTGTGTRATFGWQMPQPGVTTCAPDSMSCAITPALRHCR